ncbi:MAG: hypothetical protein IIA89_12255 [Chloroflexi bacterium]|nr:hypothetical protein [Chloroflexota bacterium]
MELADLKRLDDDGVEVIEAIAYDRAPPGTTLATPHAFVCDDGKTYWIKREAQNGLSSELIAARLGKLVGASPAGVPVEVMDGLAPSNVDVSHLIGLGVGIEDTENAQNVKELTQYLNNGTFKPSHLDKSSRARIIVFQTWIGISQDTQALVQLSSGKVLSIDHGYAFDSIGNFSKLQVVHLPIPGVADDVGTDSADIDRAVSGIERLSDEQLLKSVANVPDEPDWNAALDRRFQVFEWIRFRRDHLREAVEQWQKI